MLAFMSDVQEHYRKLLAKHYTWMFGTSFVEKVSEQKSLLAELVGPGLAGRASGLAVDLGSGPGFQSIALAQMGFSPVLAIDTSQTLLDEMQLHQGDLAIQRICNDLRDFRSFVSPGTVQVLVCMGDSITHLESKDDVGQLVKSVAEALAPGGVFILTYRDLSTELKGLDRFIPVYGDNERVMSCFLEFDRPDTVLVHDLVYCRLGARWELSKSSYRKLRLAETWLESAVTQAGLAVEGGRTGRLVRLVGRKPAPEEPP